MKKVLLPLAAACFGMVSFISPLQATPAADAATITVYSSRKEHLIKPLFDRYTAKTGTKIRFITDKASPLMARLKAEGSSTPADIFMTVDAGLLWKASEEGLFQSVNSPVLESAVPARRCFFRPHHP